MDQQALWQEIIEASTALAQQEGAKRGVLSLSPEVAGALEALESEASSDAVAPQATGAPEAAVSRIAGDSLESIARAVAACRLCDLHKTRTQVAPGEGHPQAQLVFVGEAPGADEDREGRPFVGRAGQLLSDIIVKGMKMKREEVFICNVLKCRPPENRDPLPQEIELCEAYLIRQLELIRPKVICALGRHAAQTLLKSTESTGQLRGRWHNYHNIPLRVTYHPAYLLRNPSEKKKTWEDVQEIMKLLKGEINPQG